MVMNQSELAKKPCNLTVEIARITVHLSFGFWLVHMFVLVVYNTLAGIFNPLYISTTEKSEKDGITLRNNLKPFYTKTLFNVSVYVSHNNQQWVSKKKLLVEASIRV